MDRPPCPARIFDDIGGAFMMGLVGGSIWHFAKGFRHSAVGEGFKGALRNMSKRGPVVGGNFAVWGGLFSTFDCILNKVRAKEDAWNSIAAGFLTGGFLQMRGGFSRALSGAIVGGIFLAVLEGAQVLIGKLMILQQMDEAWANYVPDPPKSGIPIPIDDHEFDFIPSNRVDLM